MHGIPPKAFCRSCSPVNMHSIEAMLLEAFLSFSSFLLATELRGSEISLQRESLLSQEEQTGESPRREILHSPSLSSRYKTVTARKRSFQQDGSLMVEEAFTDSTMLLCCVFSINILQAEQCEVAYRHCTGCSRRPANNARPPLL